jgi:hypothetical protein
MIINVPFAMCLAGSCHQTSGRPCAGSCEHHTSDVEERKGRRTHRKDIRQVGFVLMHIYAKQQQAASVQLYYCIIG